MDAILLAGDSGANGKILGKNKAFLPLEGSPLFLYVLMAVDRARYIDQIYIIGPRRELMVAIEAALPTMPFTKKIEVLEQKQSLLENALYAYDYALRRNAAGVNASDASALPPALFLPSDIPLLTASEVDAFILGSDMENYDYCMGVTSDTFLTSFYPAEGRPGIKMAYLYLKDRIYRMNNLHLVRPYSVGARMSIQTMYENRHQRYLGNRLRITREILRTPGWTRGLFLYLFAQGATFSSHIRFYPLSLFFRKFLPMDLVERGASDFLKTRFKMVETEIGGSALDIDDAVTYQAVSLSFRQWRVFLSQFDKTREAFCPMKSGVCG